MGLIHRSTYLLAKSGVPLLPVRSDKRTKSKRRLQFKVERALIHEGSIFTDELDVLYKTMVTQYRSATQFPIFPIYSIVRVPEAMFV